MGTVASQITSRTIAYTAVYSDVDQSKHQSSASLAFVCMGNSPGTGEFPAQMASNAENVSIWWRHHGFMATLNLSPYQPEMDLSHLPQKSVIKYEQDTHIIS